MGAHANQASDISGYTSNPVGTILRGYPGPFRSTLPSSACASLSTDSSQESAGSGGSSGGWGMPMRARDNLTIHALVNPSGLMQAMLGPFDATAASLGGMHHRCFIDLQPVQGAPWQSLGRSVGWASPEGRSGLSLGQAQVQLGSICGGPWSIRGVSKMNAWSRARADLA